MPRNASAESDPLRRWTVADALETYSVREWGREYFSINEAGNVTVSHERGSVDLKLLVDDLTRRGIELPLLIRFTNLLQSRLAMIHEAFGRAIGEYGFQGSYRGVYPIKVNQSRKVVEELLRFGQPYHYGLEAGSKPELLAAMAMLEDEQALVVCNGYKDVQYIETALLASKLGRTVIIVIEKPSELELVRRLADDLGVQPCLGIRMKLSSRGAGKWEQSGGDAAKFGLSASDILTVIDKLREWDLLGCLQLLHFHLGSQITAIRSIKEALREGSHLYVELVKLGCTGLSYFDVGGGLGVDYDGSQTNFDSSMNYTVREYANDVVWAIQEACEQAKIPHPVLVSESGRAVVAHHSVLVVDVIGVAESAPPDAVSEPAEDAHDLAHNLWEAMSTVSRKNLRECYHDAIEYKDQVLQLFSLGHLSLAERAQCERIFWAACRRMHDIARTLPRVAPELKRLEKVLCDIYFCNFSMFHSLPDSWAVDQLFPIMPIHRLDERPTRQAVLADITCDSDGKIDAFIGVRDVQETLELHVPDDGAYYLGIMLTGAYQEILGDLHNLFGDTNVVHVSLSGDGSYEVDEVVSGDTVADVLHYVDYSAEDLLRRVRQHVERAVRQGRMSLEESRQLMKRYRDGLAAQTYLEWE